MNSQLYQAVEDIKNYAIQMSLTLKLERPGLELSDFEDVLGDLVFDQYLYNQAVIDLDIDIISCYDVQAIYCEWYLD